MPKRGFTAPVGEWLAGPYAARYADEVLSPAARTAGRSSTCARSARWFDEHKASRADHSYVLWATWVLERWLQSVSPSRRG